MNELHIIAAGWDGPTVIGEISISSETLLRNPLVLSITIGLICSMTG